MLLNFLWFGLILLAFVSDLLTGMPFSSGMDGLSGARAGLELALTLAGPVCLWSGLSQAMERAGLTEGRCGLCCGGCFRYAQKTPRASGTCAAI